MPNGHYSDDSIEPATPPRQRLPNASAPRIICLDSSPVIASPSTMPDHSFRSAMSSGNASSMSRTSFTSPTKQTTNGHQHTASHKSSSSASSKPSSSFRSSLEQFRYAASTAKRQVAASDKSSDLSDPESSSGEERKPKKRRLVRGGGARSRSPDSSEPERESSVKPVNPLKKHLKSQDDGDDDSVREVSPPPPRKPSSTLSVPLKPATTTSATSVPAPLSDAELREKARLIIREKPLLEPKRVLAALRQTRGDVTKSIQLLTSRPSVVTTKTVSLKSTSNGAQRPLHASSLASRPAQMGVSATSSKQSLSSNPSSRSSTPTLSRVSSQTTVSQPPPVKKQPRETVEISSDDDDSDGHDRDAKEERAAVKWFNTADANALMDTTNCNAQQAETIIALRPFDDADDIEEKLGSKAAKGVTPRLFHHCKDLMAGYYEVDEVLARCEKIGRELSDAMASWLPDANQSVSRLASPAVTASVNASVAGSREGTPASTLNLSSIKKGGSSSDKFYLEEQPKLLAEGVKLKDYQLVGVNWLHLLYRKKTSCILADEMGLGKTAQVIAFFAQLKEMGIRGPHLVVAPSSVLENWDREFRFFAPSINVRKYYGSMKDRAELREELSEDPDLEVILTTYDMAAGGPQDHSFLRKFGRRGCGRSECKSDCDERDCRTGGFEVCVFDEGHMLKNRKSQKYEKLLKLKTRWRLLLTGTPLQNNLQELVSLLNFIMPQYFSDAEEALAAIFKVKAGGQQNQLSKQRVDRAKKMMHPFVLRRLKDKVLTDLTTKTTRVEYCDMTPAQRKIYMQAVARTKRVATAEAEAVAQAASNTRSKKAAASSSKESGHVLMELRKAANHPLLSRRLFDEAKIDAMARDLMKEPDYADYNFEHVKEDLRINTDAQLSFSAQTYPATRKHVLPAHEWMNSGKIQALQRLIPEIQAKGDRILIFSQFTMVLDILCVCLEHMGIKYVGFTGSTQVEDRQVLVDQFTNDSSITVFLLSTKAGGLGINLIAANWVILFDQDFNPHNDKQAADRSYRMGQTKPVTVVKLLSRGTIDEDIHALGERKLELADRVSGEDDTESDEAEQKKVAQTLLAKLREAASPDIHEISDDDNE
ncbi:related to FUN30 - protein important for chromosome integrity and segregation [Ustilago trichophora]|uniref:DNA helicase n=1 Tax=Ustilago trichophora TaxID=86804 RepID=A0A5C3E828_9BASI|nr:related to FUN30 - protein important for chromosome integrity and segregation [Ustilago trichophora]